MSKPDWDISVCGLNCAKCGLLAEGKCGGCRGALDKHWDADCKLLSCARTRQLEYCFQCEEFPCRQLIDFSNDGYDHHRITVENLKVMRQIGLTEWQKRQGEPVFCPGWKP